LTESAFGKSVFINCPFDEDYAPILQAILFCIIYLGLAPRLASENNDSGAVRLQKIIDLVKECRFSVHDLSRAVAAEAGEVFRLNMPFELGLDYGCRQFHGGEQGSKVLLILQATPYQHHTALSDLSGCDAEAHQNSYQTAVRKVRNWLASEAHLAAPGPSRILNAYADFQEWYYERQLAAGFSDEDIQDYPTAELLLAMREWIALGKPL
jgi:hypothetical protein